MLATDVGAKADAPPLDTCAMDGYALASSEIVERCPVELAVAGHCLAGNPPCALPKDSAIRVLTGAPLPLGADCVVMQEDVGRASDRIRIDILPRQREHVRLRSSDLAVGDCVLQAGRMIGPREIAAAAAAGQDTLAVRMRLPLALISTGSELREAGMSLAPGQIWNVNLTMLGSMADQPWIDLVLSINISGQIGPWPVSYSKRRQELG